MFATRVVSSTIITVSVTKSSNFLPGANFRRRRYGWSKFPLCQTQILRKWRLSATNSDLEFLDDNFTTTRKFFDSTKFTARQLPLSSPPVSLATTLVLATPWTPASYKKQKVPTGQSMISKTVHDVASHNVADGLCVVCRLQRCKFPCTHI